MQDMEEVYKTYASMVYKYVFCLTGKEEIAEEIVQETFLVAVQEISKFKGDCKITTWLCQIAKYLWYQKLRKEKRKKEISIQEIEDIVLIGKSMEEKVIQREEKMEILRKIQKLEENTKTVMYLRLLGNLEYEEIGEIMGRSANWARVTFFRGKQKIKEEEENEQRM